MKVKSLAIRSAAVTGAVAAVFTLTMEGASALTVNPPGPGWVSYDSSTNRLTAHNSVDDGWAVRARLWRDGRVVSYVTDWYSDGGSRSLTADVVNGRRYNLQACLWRADGSHACGSKHGVTG